MHRFKNHYLSLCPLLIVSFFLLLRPDQARAVMTSDTYRISSTVTAGAGSASTSANFAISTTLGQSTPLGYASNSTYNGYPGFWHTITTKLSAGDINGDGTVDLKDVICVLQIATGETPDSVRLEADADGDGRIGVVEALVGLRQMVDQ